MDNTRPVLHVGINYLTNLELKKYLNTKMLEYAKKASDNPYEPMIDLYMDNHKFNRSIQYREAFTYDHIKICKALKPLVNKEELVPFLKILIALTKEKIYEDDSQIYDSRMMISIIQTETDNVIDGYQLQWRVESRILYRNLSSFNRTMS